MPEPFFCGNVKDTLSGNQPAAKAQNRTPCRPPDGGSVFRAKKIAIFARNIFPAQKYIFFALNEKYFLRYTDRAIYLKYNN